MGDGKIGQDTDYQKIKHSSAAFYHWLFTCSYTPIECLKAKMPYVASCCDIVSQKGNKILYAVAPEIFQGSGDSALEQRKLNLSKGQP